MKSKYIVLASNPRPNQDGKPHAKAYPWWDNLTAQLNEAFPDIKLYSIGIKGDEPISGCIAMWNKSLKDIFNFTKDAVTFITIDSFLQHLMAPMKKQGIVLWGLSDPKLFGYKWNKNLFINENYFRPNQWDIWPGEKWIEGCWVAPSDVVKAVGDILKNNSTCDT
jgi:hypothetical protein